MEEKRYTCVFYNMLVKLSAFLFGMSFLICGSGFILKLSRIPLLLKFYLQSTSLNSLFWGNECLWLQLTSLVLSERISKKDNGSLEQVFNRIPLLNYRYFGSFSSDYVPTLDNYTFAIINAQHSRVSI